MYNTINLEKGLYNITSKSFTSALSQLDPDENYKGTELEGLDAFERQLKRFDIRINGKNSDKVDKFFASTQSAILFPEFVRRCILAGINDASLISDIASATTITNAVDYRGISVTSSADTDKAVAEGGTLPVTTIKMSENTTSLKKIARKISVSYEAIRQQRLDLFAVTLRAVGAQLAKTINKNAVDALTASATEIKSGSADITYSALVDFWAKFKEYNLTTMLASPDMMAKILELKEMENTKGEYVKCVKKGSVKTPFGTQLIKCIAIPQATIIGLDNTCAVEFIEGSDVEIDTDKLISTQMQDTSVSVTVGFSAIVPDAIKVLSVKA